MDSLHHLQALHESIRSSGDPRSRTFLHFGRQHLSLCLLVRRRHMRSCMRMRPTMVFCVASKKEGVLGSCMQ